MVRHSFTMGCIGLGSVIALLLASCGKPSAPVSILSTPLPGATSVAIASPAAFHAAQESEQDVTPMVTATARARPTSMARPTRAPALGLYRYSIVRTRDASLKRTRWSMDIVVHDADDPQRLAATCAAVARYGLLSHPAARAIIVFGYGAADQIDQGWDRCRASASIDSKGWNGDGKSFINSLADDGDTLVQVGSVLATDNKLFRFDNTGHGTLAS